MFASSIDDSGALIGVGVAARGVVRSRQFSFLWADGAASIGIGLLLVAVS